MAYFLHLIVLLLSLLASPAIANLIYYLDGNKGKFISNNTYSSNLNLLFSSLSSNASAAAGFAAAKTGKIPNRVYGLTLCLRDTASCHSCITTAVSDIQQFCPNSIAAIILYDECELFYSNQDFFHAPNVDSDIQFFMFNNQTISADQLFRFENLATALMDNLSDLAVRNTSRLFANGEAVLTVGTIIYGLVKCALDLSAGDCRKCLQGTVDAIAEEPLKGRKGGMALGIWCNMRYESYKFYYCRSMLHFSSDQPPSPSSLLSQMSSSPSPSPISPPRAQQSNHSGMHGIYGHLRYAQHPSFVVIFDRSSCSVWLLQFSPLIPLTPSLPTGTQYVENVVCMSVFGIVSATRVGLQLGLSRDDAYFPF